MASVLALAFALALPVSCLVQPHPQSVWTYPPNGALTINYVDTVIYSWTSRNYKNPVFVLWGLNGTDQITVSWGHMPVPPSGSYAYSFFDDITNYQHRTSWPVHVHAHLADGVWYDNGDHNGGPGIDVTSIPGKLPTTWALESTISATKSPTNMPTIIPGDQATLFLPTTGGLLRTSQTTPTSGPVSSTSTRTSTSTQTSFTGGARPSGGSSPVPQAGNTQSGSGLSSGATIGIAVAISVTVAVAAVAAVVILLRRRSKRRKNRDASQVNAGKDYYDSSNNSNGRLDRQTPQEMEDTSRESSRSPYELSENCFIREALDESFIREAPCDNIISEAPDTGIVSPIEPRGVGMDERVYPTAQGPSSPVESSSSTYTTPV